MGAIRARQQFWMELRANKPWMVAQFDDFDQSMIGGLTANYQTGLFELFAVFVIELEAVAMAFRDLGVRIRHCGFAPRCEKTWVGAEPHRTTFVGY